MISKDTAKNLGLKIKESENPLFTMLKNNFPQSIKDGKVDLDAIKQLLGLKSQENIGGYELTFTGKGLANALYNSPCEKELKLDEIYSQKTTQTPKNMIIKGDNLDALKILKSAYSGKIKMIYIDPPYNTLSDNFIYPDNFREDFKAILREVGLIETHENGQEVESENLKFFKNITGARTHSGWLAFMLPRLKLARDLLKDDGVIFISIDDNEQANLKLLCDEIFGEDNFVSCFVWRKKYGGGKGANLFVDTHEYILCYAKNKAYLSFNPLLRTGKQKEIFQFEDEYIKERGKYYIRPLKSGLDERKTLIYPIKCPDGSLIETQWICAKDTFEQLKNEGRIVFKLLKNGKYNIYKKFYENDLEGVLQESILYNLAFNADAKNEIKNIFNIKEGRDIPFTNPKPINLIKQLLRLSTSANQNKQPDIILDFFAGSGTTAHAVMELNSEDKANREFILVQSPEPIDEKESKTAFDFCKNELKSISPAISDITIERVKRASKKLNYNEGFRVFSIENKPKIIESDGSLILQEISRLSPFDKVLNLALNSGIMLNSPFKEVLKNKLYECENAYFVVEFDDEVLKILQNSQNEIYINAFSDIDLEKFLNLNVSFKERLVVIY